jgi:hypothetical protein
MMIFAFMYFLQSHSVFLFAEGFAICPTVSQMESTTTQPTNKKCLTCLPQDIIESILVRLSVSSLLRCRSVCKQWDGIVRDPQFTMTHLRRSAEPRPLLFFQRAMTLGKLCPSEAALFDEAWSPSTWDVPVIEPDDFLCASCNGLVCLYSSNYQDSQPCYW